MNHSKSPIYQTAQIREFENLAETRFGISGTMLMERAAEAAFDFLLRRFPNAKKIIVFCGSGNNGGDGYVLATLLKERGLHVSLVHVGALTKLTPATLSAYERSKALNIPILPFSEEEDYSHADLIVDAICGIGLKGNLRKETVVVIEKIARTQLPVFSLDVPTGIDADTGHLLGTAISATATMTFIGLKLGLLTGRGIAYTGELALNSLQLPSDLFAYVEPVAEKITLNAYQKYLKPRPRDWHKGLSGHVLVIGGEQGFTGAARMAGLAALRSGAGLVSLATHPDEIITNPELMCHTVKEAKTLDSLVAKADVIVIGPGLGQTDWSKMIWDYVMSLGFEIPMVVDADGLNWLAKTEQFNNNWVLTPHPGEAARLLNETTETVQKDRLTSLTAINKRYGGVTILKGAGSLILSPNSRPALCDKGNPGMSSAGMGDVLSGILGGFIAQGIPLGDAAKLSVCLHAAAGDLAAKEGERGMVATDLMPFIRRLSNIKINE